MRKPKDLVHTDQLEIKPHKTIEKRKISYCGFLSVHPDLRNKKGNNFGQLEYLKLKGLKVKQILVFCKNQSVFRESYYGTKHNSNGIKHISNCIEHISNGKHNNSCQDNSGGKHNSGGRHNSSVQGNGGDKRNSRGQNNGDGA
jgi:hypothetical protein